jgi:hypothetical protein
MTGPRKRIQGLMAQTFLWSLGCVSNTMADTKPMIDLQGFQCFIKNLKIYEAQGSQIVVNFATCPSPPSNFAGRKKDSELNIAVGST